MFQNQIAAHSQTLFKIMLRLKQIEICCVESNVSFASLTNMNVSSSLQVRFPRISIQIQNKKRILIFTFHCLLQV